MIQNPKMLSPLTLAFMGDAVFEMLVRERLISVANTPVKKLHINSVKIVCANAQSNAVALIEECLSQEEIDAFKRGRNATGNNVPKNVNSAQYRRATGLEALFGYLYFKGEFSRITEIFDIIWNNMEPNIL
jgi:ribonuclease-3 family protein